MTNTQTAPFPNDLAELVDHLAYRPGWSFRLTDELFDRGQGSMGLTLIITVHTVNSYDHNRPTVVNHFMSVPPAAFDRRSWQRWLLDQVLLVERHEACEFFTVDGVKPYAPSHGPGNDPYLIREVGTIEDRRTSFRGEVKPA